MRSIVLRNIFLIALAISLTTACAPRIPSQVPADNVQMPADFPEPWYRQAETIGRKVLRVDPARSLVTIEVRRAGTLARLGHDHVVASHNVRGYVAPEEGRSDLYVDLERLVVDEPALRAEAGFDTQPSQDAIEGTRHNMLAKVLETEHYPFAVIHSVRVEGGGLHVSITLHGVTRTQDIPAQIETLPEGIAVSGRLAFKQSDFGIVPFAVFGGALQVQDHLDLRFRIIAR